MSFRRRRGRVRLLLQRMSRMARKPSLFPHPRLLRSLPLRLPPSLLPRRLVLFRISMQACILPEGLSAGAHQACRDLDIAWRVICYCVMHA